MGMSIVRWIVLEHRCHVEAIHLRHHHVKDHQARRFFANECEGLAAIFGQAYSVAGLAELLVQKRANVLSQSSTTRTDLSAWLMRIHFLAQLLYKRFDINSAASRLEIRALGFSAMGSVNENVLPWPGMLSTQICPP